MFEITAFAHGEEPLTYQLLRESKGHIVVESVALRLNKLESVIQEPGVRFCFFGVKIGIHSRFLFASSSLYLSLCLSLSVCLFLSHASSLFLLVSISLSLTLSLYLSLCVCLSLSPSSLPPLFTGGEIAEKPLDGGGGWKNKESAQERLG